MQIQNLYIRHYRGIRDAALSQCGGLNALIGRNNAGKSTFLSAISRVYRHFRDASISAPLRSTRVADEFTNRETTEPFRIGLELAMSSNQNEQLRALLRAEAPHLENVVEKVRDYSVLSVVLVGVFSKDASFQYVETISVGKLDGLLALAPIGMPILHVPIGAAEELFTLSREARQRQVDIEAVRETVARAERFGDGFTKDTRRLELILPDSMSASTKAQVVEMLRGAEDSTAIKTRFEVFAKGLQDAAATLQRREMKSSVSTIGGTARTIPASASWIMKEIGSTKLLELHERRHPIGRDEAQQLLSLKVSRGGPNKLAALQTVVHSLLGVRLDAFQGSQERAEMDIDDFLAEANGSGIREALRIVLDIELGCPEIVLLEEPEVHLHPGLERAVDGYLRSKSLETQLFLTTHSTNFLDSFSLQNVFLVSRDEVGSGRCVRIAEEDFREIPVELGLKLSSVFMFDRLLFVEGPGDEAILRVVAAKNGIDIARAGLGFVHMGGVGNFANFAAESTLDFLARRQVRMWFSVDRDERDEVEIDRMRSRLGERATLVVQKGRDIESALLEPVALQRFIADKLRREGKPPPTTEAVERELGAIGVRLAGELATRRSERLLLKPLYLQGRSFEGDAAQRIEFAVKELQRRASETEEVVKREKEGVAALPPERRLLMLPGALVADELCKAFGCRFKKESADGVRLARLIELGQPTSLIELLKACTK